MTANAGDAGQGTGQEGAPAQGATGPEQGQGNGGQLPASQGGGQEGDGEGLPAGDQNSLDFWKAEAEKWKQSSRRHERTARDNSSAARKLQQMEDANKTELQRAQERAEIAERERAEERAERHRLLAAAAHGLGPDFLDFLGSGEEDDINARAEAISRYVNEEVSKRVAAELQRLGLTTQQPNGGAPTAAAAASLALGRRPAEYLRPGGMPASTANQGSNPNDILRRMLTERGR